MATLTTADNQTITDLDVLVSTLVAGRVVNVHYSTGVFDEVLPLRYASVKSPQFPPAVHVQGIPARSIDMVLDYLNGDAHDRSKVQFYTGEKFKNWF